MPQVLLDGATVAPEADVRSWGDLLNEIETAHLSHGRAVRAVRFDERAVESFRSPAVLATPLTGVQSVTIESMEAAAEARELLQGAPAHLDRMTRVLTDAIRLYHQNLPQQAAERLQSVLVGFDLLFCLIRSVVVTHDVHESLALCDYIYIMSRGQVVILAETDQTGARAMESRIVSALEQDKHFAGLVAGKELRVSHATYPRDGLTRQELLDKADIRF